jgi:hypothetical protein
MLSKKDDCDLVHDEAPREKKRATTGLDIVVYHVLQGVQTLTSIP